MTVNTDLARVQYNGNSVTTAFPFASRVLAASHLRVIVRITATGTETTLVLNTDYAVAGVGDPNCTINTTNPVATGSTITIIRDVPLTQTADYVENDPFPAETHENALDKLTMIEQQQQDQISRSLKFPETVATNVDGVLPVPQDNYLLVWDGVTGNIKNSSTSFGDIEANLTIVANNIADVNTVAGSIANVDIVATDISDINVAAANIGPIIAAPGAAAAAQTNANNAANSETRAYEWANNPENVPVTTGPDEFSAYHWAKKSELASDGGQVKASALDTTLGFLNTKIAAVASSGLTISEVDAGGGNLYMSARLNLDNLTIKTTPPLAAGDVVAVYNSADGTHRKMFTPVFFSGINALLEDTNPSPFNDFLLSYKTSASSAAKVKPERLRRPIAVITANNQATIDFDDFFREGYDYEVVIHALRPQNDGVSFWARLAPVGGDYANASNSYSMAFATALATVSGSNGNNSQVMLVGAGNVGNLSSETVNGHIRIINPMDANNITTLTWSLAFETDANANGLAIGSANFRNESGGNPTPAAVDSLRLMFGTGNIVSGRVTIYEIPRT